MIEPTIVLTGGSTQQVSNILGDLIERSQSLYAMLVDRKGFVLAHKEALWAPAPPALDSVASLISGNAAATQALAQLLGEGQFSELVQQGQDHSLYVDGINDLVLLVVIFDKNSAVGRVKLFAKRAVHHLDKITKEAVVNPGNLGIDSNFAESANTLLDELFGEDK